MQILLTGFSQALQSYKPIELTKDIIHTALTQQNSPLLGQDKTIQNFENFFLDLTNEFSQNNIDIHFNEVKFPEFNNYDYTVEVPFVVEGEKWYLRRSYDRVGDTSSVDTSVSADNRKTWTSITSTQDLNEIRERRLPRNMSSVEDTLSLSSINQ
jgi:hypothetical protein